MSLVILSIIYFKYISNLRICKSGR